MASISLRLRRKIRTGSSRSLLIAVAVFVIVDTIFQVCSHSPTKRLSLTSQSANHEQIFIASMHWNNEQILRSHWNDAVVNLAKHLGPQNVFLAVLEGGSWDDSKGALQDLDYQLAEHDVRRSIILDDVTHEAEISRTPANNETGWVWTPRGQKERRRIPYLADLRNRVMSEMSKVKEATGKRFDKVIWLNDVIFTVWKKTEDILNLLSTNDGEYAAACSLDFSKPPLYYDTFALRDAAGAKTATQTWPYFSAGKSRDAMMGGSPVPVQSCWNGAVVMDAQPFYGPKPLQFRGLQDELAEMHLEASECCLVHADNPLSPKKGVWVNPNVRLGYSAEAYKEVNTIAAWPTASQRFKGLWKARLATVPVFWQRKAEAWVIHPRLKRWKTLLASSAGVNNEPGAMCVVNEMQVLVGNGWEHL